MNKRHSIFYNFFRPLVIIFLRFKFGYRFKVAKNLPDNYIVLSNHTTDFDPLLVAASFPRKMYFVASEHISRWKNLYRFLKFGFSPIIRRKGTVAVSTVMEALRRVRKGDNVCIFAEGYRSWDGVTGAILPATGKMIKSARCALVTYRIEGGYFVSPNWSEGNTRRGYLYGAPVNIYTEEQLACMSVTEINAIINQDLYEDAYERQNIAPKKYKGKNLAQGMENLLFLCPKCKRMDSLYSGGDCVYCSNCDFTFKYNEYGMLEGVPFKTVKELAAWQKKQVQKDALEKVIYEAEEGTLFQIVEHEERRVAQGCVTLSENSLKCGDTEILLSDITDFGMYGKHNIVFSVQKMYYELCLARKINSLKFFLLYEEYKKR